MVTEKEVRQFFDNINELKVKKMINLVRMSTLKFKLH